MQSNATITGTRGKWSWETRWIAIFLVLGVAVRACRYLLKFPIWGDEAMLCVNFLERDFSGLMRPLDSHQVAPLLFLWIELAAIKLFGFTEWSLRLFPLLCSLASVGMFYRLARQTARLLGSTVDLSLAVVLAVGIFCASYAGVRYAGEVKPYGGDVLISIAILSLTVGGLNEPYNARWLWGLTALMPLALGLSFPAVFVAGGASIATGLALVRRTAKSFVVPPLDGGNVEQPPKGGTTNISAQRSNWLAWICYNIVLVASFSLYFFISAKGQSDAENHVMSQMWSVTFPPTDSLVSLLDWLVTVHTGPIFAHPLGGEHYGSTGTLLLFLFGVVVLARRKQYPLLALCFTPFALNLLAAALHRFPYGGHVRLAMHLMPIVCMLAGIGAASAIRTVASWRIRGSFPLARWPYEGWVACAILVAMGIVSMGRDFYRPGKEPQEIRKRDFANWFWGSMARDHEVVCLKTDLHLCFVHPGTDWHYYIAPTFLCNERIYSPRHAREELPDFSRISRDRPLAVVQYWSHVNPYDAKAFQTWLQETQQKYQLVSTERFPLPQDNDTDKVLESPDYIEVFEFIPRESAKDSKQMAANRLQL